MRILLTAHQFLPEHASGTEILTLHTAQELRAAADTMRVFTGFPRRCRLLIPNVLTAMSIRDCR